MNILPKKSWHVRTKANIEKVRKDEAKALQEQLEKAKRADLAAQERRIRQLRGRAGAQDGSRQPDYSDPIEPTSQGTQGSLQLFDDRNDSRGNRERESERRKEQEDYEKKIGLLTYLGGSQVNCESPWYMRDANQKSKKDSKDKAYRDSLRLEALDPLHDMQRFLRPSKRPNDKVRAGNHNSFLPNF
jgi:hypothetical protein